MSLSAPIMPKRYVLPFIKMQALGNDFVFVDGQQLLESAARPLLSQWQYIAPNLARKLCERRLGIGADGLILAMNLANLEMKQLAKEFYGEIANQCELSWTYHNSDGSVSQMCGNGLRCLGLWAKKNKIIAHSDSVFTVATGLGIIQVECQGEEDITVTFPAPKLNKGEIPYTGASGKNEVVKESFNLDKWQFPITCVNVGNPHCVIFEADFFKPEDYKLNERKSADDFFPKELASIARAIEIDKRFPEKTNVEFVDVLNRQQTRVYVWERGCGPTLACGSAAVATTVAGVLEGRLDKKVTVTLPGGDLFIDWSSKHAIKMTGSANISFYGEVSINVEELSPELKAFTQVKVANL